MSLYLSDIFKIFYNYEPSRLKLWEIVRSFDYLEIGKLIFLLENIKRDNKRQPIVLNREQILEFLLEPKLQNTLIHTDDDDNNDTNSYSQCHNVYNSLFEQHPNYNITSDLNLKPTLRIERVCNLSTNIFWNSLNAEDTTTIVNNNDECVETFATIIKNTKELQSHHRLDETIDYLMTALRNGNQILPETNIYASILMHNFGTPFYGSFVANVESLLLPENLQADRNELPQRISVTKRFLEYYKMFMERQIINVDAKTLRFVMVPMPQRIMDQHEFLNAPNQLGDYEFQPYYQGFHIIVYASHQETRCYNRYGELMHNIAYNLRIPLNCTFEGVLLPLDSRNRIRSWRYWPYRRSYIIYIVDVYRYEQIILLNAPFKSRIKYVDYILKNIHDNRTKLKTICATMKKSIMSKINKKFKYEPSDDNNNNNDDDNDTNIVIDNLKLNIKAGTNVIRENQHHQYKLYQHQYNALKDSINTLKILHKIPENLKTWSAIEERYSRNADVYDPIIGVIARKLNDSSLVHQNYKFNIRYLYDLVNQKIVPIDTNEDLKRINPETTFINFEMVDYMQIAIVYGNCSQYLYICEYNRDIHQFVHRVRIKRLPYDTHDINIHYKSELLYIVNNQMSTGLSKGLTYIRLYYDILHQIVGYEYKWTDSRYKMPYSTKLYDMLKNK